MRLSLTLSVVLSVDTLEAFLPQPTSPCRLTKAWVSRYGAEDFRWSKVEQRTSLQNSGPGQPPGTYDITFTPVPPLAKDYEGVVEKYSPAKPAQETRWEEIEQRTSLRNSGPGAPPARYDINFTPLTPRANDYDRTLGYYTDAEGAVIRDSRWDVIENRVSLGNSGAGAPRASYDVTFTPVPPKAVDYENTIATYADSPTWKHATRWDFMEQRTSLQNSGPGVPPGSYVRSFTPLPPVAQDYDRLREIYNLAQGIIDSRWDVIEKRTSLQNSGAGAPCGSYDVTFTPVPPVARDYERTVSYYVGDNALQQVARWSSLEQRASLNNKGPGTRAGTHDREFTPSAPAARYASSDPAPMMTDSPKRAPQTTAMNGATATRDANGTQEPTSSSEQQDRPMPPLAMASAVPVGVSKADAFSKKKSESESPMSSFSKQMASFFSGFD